LLTEGNILTLAWRGPYKVVRVVGEVDYRIEINSGKVNRYYINTQKQYFHREKKENSNAGNGNKRDQSDDKQVQQEALVACAIEDVEEAEGMTVNDAEMLPLYNLKQKETVDDFVVNPGVTTEQQIEVQQLLNECKGIFSDASTVTHLIDIGGEYLPKFLTVFCVLTVVTLLVLS